MPVHPPSARGVHFVPEPEDSVEYWQRRAQSAERDLADAQRAENDRREAAEDIAAARDRHIDQRIDAAIEKALAARAAPAPPPSYPQPPFVPQPLHVPTPSPYGFAPQPMRPAPAQLMTPPFGAYPPPVVESMPPPMMGPAVSPYGAPPMMRGTALSSPDVVAYREDRERERRWKYAGIISIPIIGLISAVVLALISHFDRETNPPPALPASTLRAPPAPHS